VIPPRITRRRFAVLCSAACAVLLASDGKASDAATKLENDQRIRALIVPSRHATLASRLQATIVRIGPNNGDRFGKGDVLVAFDCTGFQAELARADAAAEAASASVAVKDELARSGSGSRIQATLARAEAKRAAAEVAVMRNQVSQCEIQAPYDGRVVKRIANADETVGFRDPLMEIVDDASVEVRAFVPSAWIGQLALGDRFAVTIDETAATIEADIIAVGAWIDSVSQLMEVRGVVVGSSSLTAGMSGSARFGLRDRILETGSTASISAPTRSAGAVSP
jgi:membrane fusion protein, multidrug efflux system